MREWVWERLRDFGHDNRIGLLTGSLVPAQAYQKAQKLRALLRKDVLAAFQTYDALVIPTYGRQAVPLQEDPPITSKETASRLPFMRTNTFNCRTRRPFPCPAGSAEGGCPWASRLPDRPAERRWCSGWPMPTSRTPAGTP